MGFTHEKEFEINEEVTIHGYQSYKANVEEERTEYFGNMLVQVSESGRTRFSFSGDGRPYKSYSWGVIYDVSNTELHEWLDSIDQISQKK